MLAKIDAKDFVFTIPHEVHLFLACISRALYISQMGCFIPIMLILLYSLKWNKYRRRARTSNDKVSELMVPPDPKFPLSEIYSGYIYIYKVICRAFI